MFEKVVPPNVSQVLRDIREEGEIEDGEEDSMQVVDEVDTGKNKVRAVGATGRALKTNSQPNHSHRAKEKNYA